MCNIRKNSRHLQTKAVICIRAEQPARLPAFPYCQGNGRPGSLIEERYTLERFPLFVKAGAILPLNVTSGLTGLGDASMAGRRTILIYPNGTVARVLHLPRGDGIEYDDCLVAFDEKAGKLETDSGTSQKYTFIIKDMPSVKGVENAASWEYNAERQELRIDAEGSSLEIEICR